MTRRVFVSMRDVHVTFHAVFEWAVSFLSGFFFFFAIGAIAIADELMFLANYCLVFCL